MCTCASCSYTDDYADKGFAAWPRGNPAGRKSAADYAAHARHSQQWGKGRVPAIPPSLLILKPEPDFGPQGGRSFDGGAHRAYPTAADVERGTAHYVAVFIAANGYRKETPSAEAEGASPDEPGKARPHLPDTDRRGEPDARIYAMATKKKGPGRPAVLLGARRVCVVLDQATIERAQAIGESLSAGLRAAVAAYPADQASARPRLQRKAA